MSRVTNRPGGTPPANAGGSSVSSASCLLWLLAPVVLAVRLVAQQTRAARRKATREPTQP